MLPLPIIEPFWLIALEAALGGVMGIGRRPEDQVSGCLRDAANVVPRVRKGEAYVAGTRLKKQEDRTAGPFQGSNLGLALSMAEFDSTPLHVALTKVP